MPSSSEPARGDARSAGAAGVLVVGAGHAGVQVAASLRDAGYRDPVRIVTEEPHLPYHRPPLSKHAFDATASPLPLRPAAFFESRSIELVTGVSVCRLDVARRVAELSDGRTLPYDEVVLATGARPRSLPVLEVGLGGIHTLRTLDDARALWAETGEARSIVVVGAGFVGLELAHVVRGLGIAVTVVEAGQRALGRAVSEPVSAHLQRHLTDAGVELLLGDEVVDVRSEAGRVRGVVTASGRELDADLVVVAIGASPDTSLAERSGLRTDDGILVDAWLRTSAEHVSAVGDCARWPSGDGTLRLESVQNATDQARCVAARLTGGEPSPYAAVPWFWSDQGDAKLQQAGLGPAGEKVMLRERADGLGLTVLHFRDDRLTWVETVNAPADHMAGRKLLASGGATLDQVSDPGVDLKALARQLASAMSRPVPPLDQGPPAVGP